MDRRVALRYCRCGTRLARDSPSPLCAVCQRALRERATRALHVPPDFWTSSEQLRDALDGWHMGRVIAAYRSHPHHQPPLAQAIVAWRTPDRALQANTGDMAARAFAAAGDYDASMQELQRAAKALASAGDTPTLVGWYDEAFLSGIHGQCLLNLGRPAEALAILSPALNALDPAVSVRNVAMNTVDLAGAYIQQGEVDESTRLLGNAHELANRNRSVRLAIRLGEARQQLEPWKDDLTVRMLDEKVTALGTA